MVASRERLFNIRDPIHGFISIEPLEKEIIASQPFQRLRHIRQLGWTDLLYPGATHSRFEHSLGVMHVASLMFDAIVNELRKEKWRYSKIRLKRARQILRLACLAHDMGHAPFSHAGESLMPPKQHKAGENERLEHEDYSAEICTRILGPILEQSTENTSELRIKAEEVASLIQHDGAVDEPTGELLVVKPILSGILDADRADFLLRDSHYCGVKYGQYDLHRIIETLTLAENEAGEPVLAVEEGGVHAVEGLLFARWMMYTQVYLHPFRRVIDHHFSQVMQTLLQSELEGKSGLAEEGSCLPGPMTDEGLKNYLRWDDRLVRAKLLECPSADLRGIFSQHTRDHLRKVYDTGEFYLLAHEGSTREEYEKECRKAERVNDKLKRCGFQAWKDEVTQEMGGSRTRELLVVEGDKPVIPLFECSHLARTLGQLNATRIYVALEKRDDALALIARMESAEGKGGT